MANEDVKNLIRFLAPAFGLVWLFFMLYAWSLSKRYARLQRDLDDLKSRLLGQTSSSRSSS